MTDPDPLTGGDGLLVLLPAGPDGLWRIWPVSDGIPGEPTDFDPAHEPPLGPVEDGARVVALVPSDRAPVRVRPLGGMPPAQALAAARLEAAGAQGEAEPVHAAVAPGAGGVLVATVAQADMDAWLAALAVAEIVPDAIVPAALVLPAADTPVASRLGGQPIARTAQAAFAAEPELMDALGAGESRHLSQNELADALGATWREPPLNLRQGAYAPARTAFFHMPEWRTIGRMAALAAVLAFLIFAVETAKLNWDARTREAAALAAAQKRFPAAVDLATAQSLASAELARRGQGGGSFATPASAVLAALRPIPSLRLRDLGYGSDGTLRFQAAAPSAGDVNRLLTVLQQQGWQVTVPPSLAPDPTGATVAAITVRAP